MTERTSFRRGGWDLSRFRYIYSPKFSPTPRFVQEDDCIVNRRDAAGGFDYVSLITKEKFRTGTTISTRCSFEKYGAPLIVLTDDVRGGKNGELRFGHHMEIVAYVGGVNVWSLEPMEGDVCPENLLRQKFAVPEGKTVCLTVCPQKDRLEISLDGNSFSVAADCMPGGFFAGVTACEGIDRFYDFTAETP
jgi:hypothetical protein